MSFLRYCYNAGLFSLPCRTFTFWRFMIEIPLSSHEMKINYTVNNGIELNFYVPGRNQNMRWAAYSVRTRTSFTSISLIILSATGLVRV